MVGIYLSLEKDLLVLRTQIIARVKPRSILWHLQGSDFYKNRLKKGKVSGVLRAVLWESQQGFVPALGRVLKTPGCWNPGLSTALSSLKRLINGPNDSKGRATSPSQPVEFLSAPNFCSRRSRTGGEALVPSGN